MKLLVTYIILIAAFLPLFSQTPIDHIPGQNNSYFNPALTTAYGYSSLHFQASQRFLQPGSHQQYYQIGYDHLLIENPIDRMVLGMQIRVDRSPGFISDHTAGVKFAYQRNLSGSYSTAIHKISMGTGLYFSQQRWFGQKGWVSNQFDLDRYLIDRNLPSGEPIPFNDEKSNLYLNLQGGMYYQAIWNNWIAKIDLGVLNLNRPTFHFDQVEGTVDLHWNASICLDHRMSEFFKLGVVAFHDRIFNQSKWITGLHTLIGNPEDGYTGLEIGCYSQLNQQSEALKWSHQWIRVGIIMNPWRPWLMYRLPVSLLNDGSILQAGVSYLIGSGY